MEMFDDLRRMNKRQQKDRFQLEINMPATAAAKYAIIGEILDRHIMPKLIGRKGLKSSLVYFQFLNFAMIVASALMIWKGLMVVTGSESPIVVVLSGSMEPAFYRGDLLFLTNYQQDKIRAGEIVVFKIDGRDIPIVHRVIKVHERPNGKVKFLTKGDNNEVDDRGLYKPGQLWVERDHVVGRARGFVPYVGMVTILMNDYPKLKYAVLGLLGIFVLVHRE